MTLGREIFRADKLGVAFSLPIPSLILSPVHDPRIPDAVLRDFLAPLGVVASRAISPGMSGAQVFRCELQSGHSVALKRLPESTGRARVEEIHRVITYSSQHGCSLVPQVMRMGPPDQNSHSVLVHEGHCWETLRWMPGTTLGPVAETEQIQRGAAAIAQFHASVRGMGVCQQPPPAVIARLKRLQELERLWEGTAHLATEFAGPPILAEAIQNARQLVQWKWDEVRRQIARSLSQYADCPVDTQYVLRDVHRAHILFCDGEVAGLIDFDAIRIDTPATDLARWAGSFLCGDRNTQPVWDAVMAGFQGENTLMNGSGIETDLQMAKDLCFATTWISLMNWLVWIVSERRSFPPGPTAVAERLRELIGAASDGA